jgi:hypothetical protein
VADWEVGGRRKRKVSASAKRRRRIGDGRRHSMARVASARRDLGRRTYKRGGGGDDGSGGTRIGDGRGLRGGLPRSHMWPAARLSEREVGGRAAEKGRRNFFPILVLLFKQVLSLIYYYNYEI